MLKQKASGPSPQLGRMLPAPELRDSYKKVAARRPAQRGGVRCPKDHIHTRILYSGSQSAKTTWIPEAMVGSLMLVRRSLRPLGLHFLRGPLAWTPDLEP